MTTPNPDTYNDITNPEHRARYAQHFTPNWLADFMVRWTLNSPNQGLHDPALGLGAFLAPTRLHHPLTRFTANELDNKVLEHWSPPQLAQVNRLRRRDFLSDWDYTYPNVVCNPPYQRFQNFPGHLNTRDQIALHTGIRLHGNANAASAFLIKAIYQLQPHGRLAFLMPLEFLHTTYGRAVKTILLKGLHLAALIRINCENDAFPRVITSAGIILYDTGTQHHQVTFATVDDPDQLHHQHLALANRIPTSDLDPKLVWHNHFQEPIPHIGPNRSVPMAHHGSFIRGIATGANRFFVITPSKAETLGLHENDTQFALTSSKQVSQPVLKQTHLDDLAAQDSPILLFNPKGQPSASALRYIHAAEAHGIHQTYLTAKRPTWYRPETRHPPAILAGVFSRVKPKIIRNLAPTTHLSSFHGFQPNLFAHDLVDQLFLFLCSNTGTDLINRVSRIYGNQLHKLEPNDLNQLLVPDRTRLSTINHQSAQTALDMLHQRHELTDQLQEVLRQIAYD